MSAETSRLLNPVISPLHDGVTARPQHAVLVVGSIAMSEKLPAGAMALSMVDLRALGPEEKQRIDLAPWLEGAGHDGHQPLVTVGPDQRVGP